MKIDKATSRLTPISAFSLMEVLIVVSVVVTLAVTVIALIDPQKQLNKSFDSRRKTDLTTLSKKLEDWYNDKNCYPTPAQICYDGPVAGASNTVTCNICGTHANSPNDLLNHIDRLPCDPEFPRHNYLYQTQNISCPTWFRLYSDLRIDTDPVIASLGCYSGCGPSYQYNYGVSSPNIGLERNPLQTTPTPFPTTTGGPTTVPTAVPTTPSGPQPSLTPTPTTNPNATPTPTPITGSCIHQSDWSSCSAYCQAQGKTCYSSESNYTYQGYSDISCNTSAGSGCTSGGNGCCNSWPFLYTRVRCYCQ